METYNKILFVSEDNLPDIRIEKMINTLSNMGEEIHFIGDYKGFTGIKLYKKPIIHRVKWDRKTNLLIPPYYIWVKKKVEKIIEEIKPDLIIAENLIAAYMLDELKQDFIFDYHEVWSLLLRYISPPTLLRRLTYLRRKKIYPKLEEKILPKYPLITISDNAAKYFKEEYGVARFTVVKNYPSKLEVKDILFNEIECSTKQFIYVGRDFVFFDGQQYRDLRPTVSILDKLWSSYKRFKIKLVGTSKANREYVEALGWIKHIDLYKILAIIHYGILTYKPSPPQYLVNPNKPYMYGHSGVIPLITGSIEEIVNDLGGYSIIIDPENYINSLEEKYREAIETDCETINKMRKRIYSYCREKLVWENQERKILSFIKSS